MSRDDLLNVNFGIMKAVTEQVVKYSPNCIIVPVANPLDAMCQAVYRLSGFPRERVIGMAGVLDSARMRTFIAMETERVGRERPRLRARRPRRHDGAAAALLDRRRRADHRADVQEDPSASRRSASGPPTAAPRSRSWSAPAPGMRPARRRPRWSSAILKDKKKILPCSVFLQGEYGIRDLFVGVPVKLGARGLEQIIEITAHAPRRTRRCKKSAGAVKELVDVIKV